MLVIKGGYDATIWAARPHHALAQVTSLAFISHHFYTAAQSVERTALQWTVSNVRISLTEMNSIENYLCLYCEKWQINRFRQGQANCSSAYL